MRIRWLAACAALGVASFGVAPVAFAGDEVVVSEGRVVAFDDVGARFNVQHDAKLGTMTFRLADDAKVRIASAPTVTLRTDAGPRDVALVAVDGQPNTWRLSHEVLRSETIDGTMKIVVDGRPYTTSLVAAAATDAPAGAVVETKVVAKYGGRVISFPDCGGNIEVVQDPATGTLTVYSLMGEDVKIVDAPVITVTEEAGPRTISLVKVDGETVAWRVSNPVFKTTTLQNARIKIMVDGKPCETALVTSAAGRGGEIVTIDGGPRFEVVRDVKTNAYTFYQLDETIEGRPVVIEQPPAVVWGERTYPLVAVPGEPRAWRLAGIDAAATPPGDARLRVSLFGRSLETNVGLSGIGIGVK
jgi:hypothetical protein